MLRARSPGPRARKRESSSFYIARQYMISGRPKWLNDVITQLRGTPERSKSRNADRSGDATKRSRRRHALAQAMVLELLEVRQMLATVVGRSLFYNNSAF